MTWYCPWCSKPVVKKDLDGDGKLYWYCNKCHSTWDVVDLPNAGSMHPLP